MDQNHGIGRCHSQPQKLIPRLCVQVLLATQNLINVVKTQGPSLVPSPLEPEAQDVNLDKGHTRRKQV